MRSTINKISLGRKIRNARTKEKMTFCCPIDEEFRRVLEIARSK